MLLTNFGFNSQKKVQTGFCALNPCINKPNMLFLGKTKATHTSGVTNSDIQLLLHFWNQKTSIRGYVSLCKHWERNSHRCTLGSLLKMFETWCAIQFDHTTNTAWVSPTQSVVGYLVQLQQCGKWKPPSHIFIFVSMDACNIRENHKQKSVVLTWHLAFHGQSLKYGGCLLQSLNNDNIVNVVKIIHSSNSLFYNELSTLECNVSNTLSIPTSVILIGDLKFLVGARLGTSVAAHKCCLYCLIPRPHWFECTPTEVQHNLLTSYPQTTNIFPTINYTV